MIDIHSHILPGVDDGASSIEESLAMARQAVADGVTVMLTTSHSAEWLQIGHEAKMIAQIESLQHAFAGEGVPLQLRPGLEIYLTLETPGDLAAGRVWPLAHSRYLLVETAFHIWPPYVEKVLFDLQVAGYWPILAHPERYGAIQREPRLMAQLADRGVLGQLSTESLLGNNGSAVQQCAQVLLDHNLVQFLASDAHHTTMRPPGLAAALAVARERLGPAANDLVTANPQRILDNQPLTPSPQPIATKRSFFSRLFGSTSSEY